MSVKSILRSIRRITSLCLLSVALVSCDGNSSDSGGVSASDRIHGGDSSNDGGNSENSGGNANTATTDIERNNAPTANQLQAPSSFAGKSARLDISSGSGLFANSGTFIINVSSSGNEYYSVVESGNAAGSYGAFRYRSVGNQGLAVATAQSYSFSDLGAFDAELTLTFTSENSGTFLTTIDSQNSIQRGSFTIIDTTGLQAPSSIAGKSIRIFFPSALNRSPYVISFGSNTIFLLRRKSDGDTTSGTYRYSSIDNVGSVDAISEDGESATFAFTFISESQGAWRFSNFSDVEELGGFFEVVQ